jgi:hypothetical protein
MLIISQTLTAAIDIVMIDPNLFPPLPKAAYGPEQLHQYLASLVSQGHTVYRDPEQLNVFYILLTEAHRIRISVSEGHSQVQLQYLSNVQNFLDVSTLPDLEKAIGTLAAQARVMWPSKPTAGRVRTDTPATNYRTISNLIGSSRVVAIFDPYLDNNTLEELRIIISFGNGSVDDGVRLLGGAEKSQGKLPTFTAVGVAAWLKQQGIKGEARFFPSKTEHRRFILLNDGCSLITGHSLNAPHKNEVVHIDTSNQDQEFFELTWNTSTTL